MENSEDTALLTEIRDLIAAQNLMMMEREKKFEQDRKSSQELLEGQLTRQKLTTKIQVGALGLVALLLLLLAYFIYMLVVSNKFW